MGAPVGGAPPTRAQGSHGSVAAVAGALLARDQRQDLTGRGPLTGQHVTLPVKRALPHKELLGEHSFLGEASVQVLEGTRCCMQGLVLGRRGHVEVQRWHWQLWAAGDWRDRLEGKAAFVVVRGVLAAV